jgi:hypothetical protein
VTRSKFGTRRRAVLLAGLAVAASASLLLSGCGSGQVSSTADTVPAIDGIDAEVAAAGGAGSYAVRNLVADFKLGGYPAGSDAPLAVTLFNDTGAPVTVRVSSPQADVRLVGAAPTSAGTPTGPAPTTAAPTGGGATPEPGGSPTESPAASPTATPTPAGPAGEPATFTIQPGGFVLLNQQQESRLVLTGLRQDLNEGNTVPVVFDFGGQRLTVDVGLAVPLSPLPRGPRVVPDEGDEANLAPEQG